MNCIRKLPMIKKQLMQRIQKFYSLLLRIQIKPQQLRHLMMSETCLDVKRLFAWMKKIMDFQWFEHVTWDSIKDL